MAWILLLLLLLLDKKLPGHILCMLVMDEASTCEDLCLKLLFPHQFLSHSCLFNVSLTGIL